jgi:hypothetical protein
MKAWINRSLKTNTVQYVLHEHAFNTPETVKNMSELKANNTPIIHI